MTNVRHAAVAAESGRYAVDFNRDSPMSEPSLADYLRPGDRVLVVGGYGARNVGDDAILSGLLSQLPAGADVRVVSRDPAETAALHGVRAIGPAQAGPAMLRSSAVVFGGGGIFSSHMGPFARTIPLFGIGSWLLRKRILFHGIGIYPSTPRIVVAGLRVLLPHAALLTVRDRASAVFLEGLGLRPHLVRDLSTAMPESAPDRVLRLFGSLELDTTRPVVGLALTATEPGSVPDLVREVPLLVNGLPEVQFCFVPMSRHPAVPRQNDLVLARRIQVASPGIKILEGAHHPADILGLFGRFDAVVAMRYHSMLFAERSGTPIVPISYAEKTSDWILARGLESVPIRASSLSARIRRILADGAVR